MLDSRGVFLRGPDMPVALHGILALSVENRSLVLGGTTQAGSVTAAGRSFIYEPAAPPSGR